MYNVKMIIQTHFSKTAVQDIIYLAQLNTNAQNNNNVTQYTQT